MALGALRYGEAVRTISETLNCVFPAKDACFDKAQNREFSDI
jgi:hypothetical protein